MTNEDMAKLLDIQDKLIEQYEQYKDLQSKRIEYLESRIEQLNQDNLNYQLEKLNA